MKSETRIISLNINTSFMNTKSLPVPPPLSQVSLRVGVLIVQRGPKLNFADTLE
jgi:hypothetical protein